MNEYDQIMATIRKVGSSHVITIPNKAMEFMGLKEGDLVKAWIKKKKEE